MAVGDEDPPRFPLRSPSEPQAAAPETTRATRLLSVITEVHGHEVGLAVVMGLNIFLVLTAQYILKPVREALILSVPHGAEYKSYTNAALVLLMLALVPLYGALADRLKRNRLILGTTMLSILAIVAFFWLGQYAALRPYLGVPFLLFVGVFGMMAVAQFWGFANDLYSEEQGVRLFVLIALGQSLGAVAGSGLTTFLLTPPAWWPAAPLDEFTLLWVSGGCLAVTLPLTQVAHRWSKRHQERRLRLASPAPTAPVGFDKREALRLILRSRYLLCLALLHFVFTLVNSNGEYLLGVLVAEAAPADGLTLDGLERGAWIGDFFGNFFFWVSILGLLIQLGIVSRVIRYGGIKAGLLVLPILALSGAGLVAAVPILAVVAVAKTLENATDYSLHNTVRQMLWLPTSRDAKYKAKQAVDAFFVRCGDAVSGLLVFVGVNALDWAVRGFALANLALAALWIVLAVLVLRQNARLTRQEREAPAARPMVARPARRAL